MHSGSLSSGPTHSWQGWGAALSSALRDAFSLSLAPPHFLQHPLPVSGSYPQFFILALSPLPSSLLSWSKSWLLWKGREGWASREPLPEPTSRHAVSSDGVGPSPSVCLPENGVCRGRAVRTSALSLPHWLLFLLGERGLTFLFSLPVHSSSRTVSLEIAFLLHPPKFQKKIPPQAAAPRLSSVLGRTQACGSGRQLACHASGSCRLSFHCRVSLQVRC